MGLGSFVFVQVALSLKRNSTGGTGVRSLPRVATEVLLQDAGFHAVPSAVGAHMLSCRFGSGCSRRSRMLCRLRLQPTGNVQSQKGKFVFRGEWWHSQMESCSRCPACSGRRLGVRLQRQSRHWVYVQCSQWSLDSHPFLCLSCDRADMHWKTCQCRLASLHGNCCRCDEPETLLPVGEEQFVLGFGIVSDQISLRGDVFHSKRAKCDLSVYH